MAGNLADSLVLQRGGGGGGATSATSAGAGADEDGVVDLDGGVSSSSCGGSVVDMECVPVKSLLDSVLLAMWEECAEQGLFRCVVCVVWVCLGVFQV